jgi:hypothetical protein
MPAGSNGSNGTIGFSLRLLPDEHAAIDRLIPRGKKNEWIRLTLRRELLRQGALKPDPPDTPRKGKSR